MPISSARRSQPLPPRWPAPCTPSSRAAPIIGPSSRGRCQAGEPLSVRAVRARHGDPVDNARVFRLESASRVEDGEGQCTALRTLCSLWPRAHSLTAEAAWTTLTWKPLINFGGERSVAAPNAQLPDVGRCRKRQLVGRPRRAINASSSRATRAPESEVSAISARHSRVKSSTIARMRKRRPSVKRVGDEVERPTLDSDRSAARSALRVPSARLRPPRLRTCSFSSR